MIRIQGLSKSYGRIQALQGVDLTLRSGQVTGLLGPNACGKTTLIKSILGLVIPDSGTIEIDGRAIGSDGQHRRLIGYLPQNPDFPANLSIRELLEMMADIRGEKASRREELVRLFGLESSLGRVFSTLSGGTKQKVGATLAFMFDSPFLILDEPTVGLDPVAALHLKGLIRDAVTRGRTVLLVSHIVSEIEQLVSDIAFLLEGKVVYSGSLESALARRPGSRLEDSIVALMAERGARP